MRWTAFRYTGATSKSVFCFLDHQLRALGDREHFGGDGGPFEDRLPDLEFGVIPIGQHAIERDLFAGGEIAVVDIELLALFHFELASAFRDDRVHGTVLSHWSHPFDKPLSLADEGEGGSRGHSYV